MSRSTCLAVVLLPLLLLWCGGGGGPTAAQCAPQLPFNSLLSTFLGASAGAGQLAQDTALSHLQHQLGTLASLGSLFGLGNLTDTAFG